MKLFSIFKKKKNPTRNFSDDTSPFSNEAFLEKPFSEYDQEIIYPWHQVMACYFEKLHSSKFIGLKGCPKCKTPSEKLVWIMFCNPKHYWENLGGAKGEMSICERCRKQVEFIMLLMN